MYALDLFIHMGLTERDYCLRCAEPMARTVCTTCKLQVCAECTDKDGVCATCVFFAQYHAENGHVHAWTALQSTSAFIPLCAYCTDDATHKCTDCREYACEAHTDVCLQRFGCGACGAIFMEAKDETPYCEECAYPVCPNCIEICNECENVFCCRHADPNTLVCDSCA